MNIKEVKNHILLCERFMDMLDTSISNKQVDKLENPQWELSLRVSGDSRYDYKGYINLSFVDGICIYEIEELTHPHYKFEKENIHDVASFIKDELTVMEDSDTDNGFYVSTVKFNSDSDLLSEVIHSTPQRLLPGMRIPESTGGAHLVWMFESWDLSVICDMYGQWWYFSDNPRGGDEKDPFADGFFLPPSKPMFSPDSRRIRMFMGNHHKLARDLAKDFDPNEYSDEEEYIMDVIAAAGYGWIDDKDFGIVLDTPRGERWEYLQGLGQNILAI